MNGILIMATLLLIAVFAAPTALAAGKRFTHGLAINAEAELPTFARLVALKREAGLSKEEAQAAARSQVEHDISLGLRPTSDLGPAFGLAPSVEDAQAMVARIEQLNGFLSEERASRDAVVDAQRTAEEARDAAIAEKATTTTALEKLTADFTAYKKKHPAKADQA